MALSARPALTLDGFARCRIAPQQAQARLCSQVKPRAVGGWDRGGGECRREGAGTFLLGGLGAKTCDLHIIVAVLCPSDTVRFRSRNCDSPSSRCLAVPRATRSKPWRGRTYPRRRAASASSLSLPPGVWGATWRCATEGLCLTLACMFGGQSAGTAAVGGRASSATIDHETPSGQNPSGRRMRWRRPFDDRTERIRTQLGSESLNS